MFSPFNFPSTLPTKNVGRYTLSISIHEYQTMMVSPMFLLQLIHFSGSPLLRFAGLADHLHNTPNACMVYETSVFPSPNRKQ